MSSHKKSEELKPRFSLNTSYEITSIRYVSLFSFELEV